MRHKYFQSLLVIALMIVFILSVFCVNGESAQAKEEKSGNPKDFLSKAITATFESEGFYFKGKGYFKVTAPKTNILINSAFSGRTKNPDLSHLILESEETGEKLEAYRNGKKAAVKDNKKNKWTRQNIASPHKFIKFYADTLKEIKFLEDEEVDGTLCQPMEATINQNGINNLLALYKIAILPNAKKSSNVKIWIGKKDNLVYKITVSLWIHAKSLPNPLEDDDENLPPDKKNKNAKATNVKFNAEVLCFDYNKNISIEIPQEVKEIFNNIDKE